MTGFIPGSLSHNVRSSKENVGHTPYFMHQILCDLQISWLFEHATDFSKEMAALADCCDMLASLWTATSL